MGGDVVLDVAPDEAYWQSLLRDVEAQTGARVEIDGLRGDPGVFLLDLTAAWQAARRASDHGETITVKATGCNRGGLLIDWNGLRGFMPASHLCGLAPHLDEETRRGELAQRVGRTLDAKVIEIDREQCRFVVSERLACTEHAQRDALLAELAPNQVRSGHVTNVCSFGAFVDLGGVEGLLHISEMSWGRVNHPSDLLSIDQEVGVLVMSVDPDQGRIALSLKRLQPDPWLTVDQRYHVGDVVDGVITGVVAFGAFARLAEGLEGLIHVSELAEGNFLHPHNVVEEGQAVRVRILNVDGPHRRLGLSLRQAEDSHGMRDDSTD